MSTRELQDRIIATMRRWQKIEDASVVQTSEIIAKTRNPVIRMVMEIIRADSERHYRVQELIASSLESGTVSLSPEEVAEVWDMIRKHIEMETQAEKMAEESLAALRGKKMLIQEYFLHYLMEDEAKHDHLLDNLDMIKKGMYPYA